MSRVINTMKPARNRKLDLMNKSFKISVVLSAALITGCASFQRDHFTVGSVPTDYRTEHPIVVSQSEVSQDLVISRGLEGMSLRQQNVVTSFVGKFNLTNAQTIRVLLPAGSHNEDAARRVGRDIVKHIKSLGVKAHQINVSRYHASNHGDAATLRLSYDAITAGVASKCGQWDEDLIETSENKNYGNFGCSTQNNLAQIIANPEDLLGPRGESEIDAERRDNVITDFRQGGNGS